MVERLFGELGGILFIWLEHAVIAAVLTAPIVFFGRKRVHWRTWELLMLVLPFAVWTFLMFSELGNGSKSLANLAEPLIFAPAIPIVTLIRVAIGRRVPERPCAACLLILMCALAASVYFFVPPLPE